MFNLDRKCPICNNDMEYRPNKLWTGMRYQTNVHEWRCHGDKDDTEKHSLKLSTVATEEFKEWEKYK